MVERWSLRPEQRLPLLLLSAWSLRNTCTCARAVVDMGEKTLKIGTGVENLIVSRAGHLALQLNPRNWHREVNVVMDIPACLQTDRQTETDRDRQRQTETDRDRQRQTETDIQTDTHTHTDRQTDRQAGAHRADDPPRTIQITTQQESHRQRHTHYRISLLQAFNLSSHLVATHGLPLTPGRSSLEAEKSFRNSKPKRLFTRSSQPTLASTRFAEGTRKTFLFHRQGLAAFSLFNL